MVDIASEINRLRQSLLSLDIEFNEVEGICRQASSEIEQTMADIAENFLNYARELVLSVGGGDVVDQLEIVQRGEYPAITTNSGSTDFTVPELHMLPHLLKNAKMSKDGTLYKVIPIGHSNNRPKDIFSAYQNVNQSRQMANINQRDMNKNKREITFRTATSKQDPGSQWVLPPRNYDIAMFLIDINSQLEVAVDSSVLDIVAVYGGGA